MTKSKRYFFLAFVISGAIVLASLGGWQVKRLTWKNEIIQKIEIQQKQDTVPLVELRNDDLSYHKVSLSGRYDYDRERFLILQKKGEVMGVHHVVPFVLNNGKMVVVDRGWLPETQKDSLKSVQEKNIEGILIPPPRSNIFTPKNNPNSKDIYWIALEDILSKEDIEKAYPYLLLKTSVFKNDMPQPYADVPSIRNKHLSYALFWFTLSLSLIGIGYLVLRK